MISQNDDEDMFEDYPQDFIEKMDDLKGKASKASKVSMFEHCRNGYDEIESPKGTLSACTAACSFRCVTRRTSTQCLCAAISLVGRRNLGAEEATSTAICGRCHPRTGRP